LSPEYVSALPLAPYVFIKAEKVSERLATPSAVAEFNKL
jgi:hypothetical protein